MVLSLDTEVTGIDLFHGALPFFVSTCDDEGTQVFWEWDVDPLTRRPEIPEGDTREVRQLLARQYDGIVGQNIKFDARALFQAGITDWTPLWEITEDTLIAGHLLASNAKHDLTSMCLEWLGDLDLQPFEKDLESAVKEARNIARADLPDWRIAKAGEPDLPSAKEETWRFDYWLPRALAVEKNWPRPDDLCEHDWAGWCCFKCCGHRFWVVLRDYSKMDAVATLALWKVQRAEIKRRRHWQIYKAKMKVLPSLAGIEGYGITYRTSRKEQLEEQYLHEALEHHDRCVELSDGQIEKLPLNGRSNALNELVFGKFGLTHEKKTKNGHSSMDASVLDDWLLQLPDGKPKDFITNFKAYRKRRTAISFIDSYSRYGLPLDDQDEWKVLHGSVNPTGSVHLRMSMERPNGQQISKQEIAERGQKGHNARWMFGPPPGWEWYSADGKNLELVIPAYEAGEEDLIWVFEHPDDPPYFGSYHLVVAELIFPKEWKDHPGNAFKNNLPHLYRQVKNGNFSRQYGAQKRKVDATFGVEGAFDLVSHRFPKIDALAKSLIDFANRKGYVETIPDRTVDSEHGYPILISREGWQGKVKPTLPMSYHTSGSACWWMLKGQTRCHERLRKSKSGGKMILQVHDELLFAFPTKNGRGNNLREVAELRWLMEMGGDDLGIVTPVSVELHTESWEKGTEIKSEKSKKSGTGGK